MKQKINLLFDATILIRGHRDFNVRTGIYFAAYNLLRQLSKKSEFNISLYIHGRLHDIYYFKKNSFISQFPLYINSRESFKNSYTYHKNIIFSNTNIQKKITSLIKITINYLFFLYYHKDNSYHLKSVDVFFSPIYTTLIELEQYPHIKHFILLHDAIPFILPHYFPDINSGDFWFNKIVKAINKSTYYFFNSECTKHDFIKYCGSQFDINKMMVVYHASSQIFSPAYDKTKLSQILSKYQIQYKNENKFIFSFCTIEPRKNLLFTVRCFLKFIRKNNIDNLYFYMGGPQWDSFVHQLEEEIDNFYDHRDKIVRLGYVDDEDVNILYSNSIFFTYISQYEGFGVPPLEAMQSGTPVITSNNSSLPEVVGNAAIMIDYDSEEQCIKAFENLYFNENLRNEYIKKGLEQSKLFSWKKTVDIMTEFIIKALT